MGFGGCWWSMWSVGLSVVVVVGFRKCVCILDFYLFVYNLVFSRGELVFLGEI